MARSARSFPKRTITKAIKQLRYRCQLIAKAKGGHIQEGRRPSLGMQFFHDDLWSRYYKDSLGMGKCIVCGRCAAVISLPAGRADFGPQGNFSKQVRGKRMGRQKAWECMWRGAAKRRLPSFPSQACDLHGRRVKPLQPREASLKTAWQACKTLKTGWIQRK